MPDLDVAAIAARVEKATPGPWKVETFGDGIEPGVVTVENDGGCSDPECCGGPSYYVRISPENADFLSHVREDIPVLLAENARLREGLRRIGSHEWILSTAHNGADFGWQVNVPDGEPKKGSQHYKPLPGSFGEHPWDAVLAALAAGGDDGE